MVLETLSPTAGGARVVVVAPLEGGAIVLGSVGTSVQGEPHRPRVIPITMALGDRAELPTILSQASMRSV